METQTATRPTHHVMGFTVTNKEQCRSVLLVAKLQGRDHVVKQCLSLLDFLPEV